MKNTENKSKNIKLKTKRYIMSEELPRNIIKKFAESDETWTKTEME